MRAKTICHITPAKEKFKKKRRKERTSWKQGYVSKRWQLNYTQTVICIKVSVVKLGTRSSLGCDSRVCGTSFERVFVCAHARRYVEPDISVFDKCSTMRRISEWMTRYILPDTMISFGTCAGGSETPAGFLERVCGSHSQSVSCYIWVSYQSGAQIAAPFSFHLEVLSKNTSGFISLGKPSRSANFRTLSILREIQILKDV